VGIILGTGLSQFAEQNKGDIIPFRSVKGLPGTTITGHKNFFKVNKEQGIIMMAGRFHYYEGWDMDDLVLPVFLLAGLGIKTLIVTNASGAINPLYTAGEFVLIRDHINLLGDNPLRGPYSGKFNLTDRECPRFLDLSEAYSKRLSDCVQKHIHSPLREGVYAAMPGPCFETPAEIRMLEQLGADMVGMSTVPEVLAARFLGLEVLGISLITNEAAGKGTEPVVRLLSHEENLQVGAQRSGAFEQLLKEILFATGYKIV
jgi:purine-nucleoside phosphorylase